MVRWCAARTPLRVPRRLGAGLGARFQRLGRWGAAPAGAGVGDHGAHRRGDRHDAAGVRRHPCRVRPARRVRRHGADRHRVLPRPGARADGIRPAGRSVRRKPTLYLGVGVYLAGAIGSALAPNFELLLVSRFVWGVGAAGSWVVAIRRSCATGSRATRWRGRCRR